MTEKITPSFIISGTASSSGKTTIALGLMAAFKKRGFTVQPFKCGPDFIDPGLHKLITGTTSRNLDVWMCGMNHTRLTFEQNIQKADIGIVEGVMGMFDGGESSSAALAHALGIPGILVIDCRSMAESTAAIVKGFSTLDPDVAPKGIILNRIGSDRHLQLVKDAISAHCNVEILGYLPKNIHFSIPSRHLGLLTSDESPIDPQDVDILADQVSKYIDLDRLVELGYAPRKKIQYKSTPRRSLRCRIAVARDRAFSFYYEDNFDILREKGAEIVFFSPLEDKKLPEDIQGIYLGGGYPELYAKKLSANHGMVVAVQRWIDQKGPVYAECGGFMYLTAGINDHDHNHHSMVGCFPVQAYMQNKRTALGYREIRTSHQSFFGPAGTVMRGHEFHYSHIEPMPTEIKRIYTVNNNTLEGYSQQNVLGGYMHLHFGYSPQVAENFVNFCQEKAHGC